MTLFLLCAMVQVALGAEPDTPLPFTDTNSVQALRNLKRITEKSTDGLVEAELTEWVRARFALIALLRLEGKNDEAIAAFANCGAICSRHGPTEEWKAIKAWGCGKAKLASPCKK